VNHIPVDWRKITLHYFYLKGGNAMSKQNFVVVKEYRKNRKKEILEELLVGTVLVTGAFILRLIAKD